MPSEKALICHHPHAIYTFGLLFNSGLKETGYQNITILGSRFALAIPFVGLLLKFWGVEGVNNKNF